MIQNTYNGYTNYETWLLKLHIDNEESTYHLFRNETIAALTHFKGNINDSINFITDVIESWIDDNVPDTVSVFADLLNSAISEIDYHYIAETLVNDYYDEWLQA